MPVFVVKGCGIPSPPPLSLPSPLTPHDFPLYILIIHMYAIEKMNGKDKNYLLRYSPSEEDKNEENEEEEEEEVEEDENDEEVKKVVKKPAKKRSKRSKKN
jgi:hypothetical protein